MSIRRKLLALGIATVALGAIVAPAEAAVAHPLAPVARQLESAHSKRFTSTPIPKISGRAKVGATLTAKPGHWRPGTVKLSYRWRIDGRAIPFATHRTYVVRKADQQHRITVEVKGTKRGYRAKTKRSKSIRIARIVTSAPPVVSVPTPAPVPTTPPVVPVPAPTPVVPPAPAQNYAIAGDGKYLVGSGVQAGLYVTSGSTRSCYWETDSSFDGQLSSINANDLGSGQRIMRIQPSDYGVSLSDCGPWITSDRAPSISAITTGVYLVGQQVARGTYTASVPSGGCYWATLSDFDGSIRSIIANDFETGSTAIVAIPANGVGFETSGCGLWTRIG